MLLLNDIKDVMDVAGRDRHWTLGLFINLLGYSAVFLPGILILNYVKKTNYLEHGPHKCLGPLIRLCFFGSEETIDDSIAKDETTTNEGNSTTKTSSIIKNSDLKVVLNLVFCFVGLQVSYLTWGILQEKIMTRKYEDSAGNVGLFKDSQFLVFVNRVLAFAVALLYIMVSRQPR